MFDIFERTDYLYSIRITSSFIGDEGQEFTGKPTAFSVVSSRVSITVIVYIVLEATPKQIGFVFITISRPALNWRPNKNAFWRSRNRKCPLEYLSDARTSNNDICLIAKHYYLFFFF